MRASFQVSAALLLLTAAWACSGKAAEPPAGCSGDPNALTAYAGNVSTLMFPSSYAPRQGHAPGPAPVVQRVYGLPCDTDPALFKQIQQYDVDEHRYYELGVIKVDVLRRDGERPLDLEVFRQVLLPGFKERGSVFTVVDPGLAWPAFQVDITSPYPLAVVLVETPTLIHYVVAGRSDAALRTVLESIQE